MQTVAIFGLGEAGSLFAADLANTGIEVFAYDPADVVTPLGVSRVYDPHDAVGNADVILALTGGQDAATAIRQALRCIPRSALYADLSSNAPATKRELAAIAADAGFAFADVALLSTVPGKGLFTPQIAAGSGAVRYVEQMAALDVEVGPVSDAAGDAATLKLLRSVVVKGLASLVIEAMRAADAAGQSDWLWENIVDQLAATDARMLMRLVLGTEKHASRRLHEMQAAATMLEDLGVRSIMTSATVENLRDIPDAGIPDLPVRGDRSR